MAWLLTIGAAVKCGAKLGMLIVVVPYKFLVLHLKQAAEETLRSFSSNIHVSTVTVPDCSSPFLPPALDESEGRELPNLLILSVDVMSALFDHHHGSLLRWSRAGKLHRIFLDEVHTVMGEGFRRAYDTIPYLAGLGVPTMALSATVPSELIEPLCHHFNLSPRSEGREVIKIIESRDLLGHYPKGFVIDFTFCQDLVQKTKERLASKDIYGRPSRSSFSVHILCSSKVLANNLYNDLNQRYKSLLVVSGQSEKDQQESA